MEFTANRHVSFQEARALVPTKDGKPFDLVFRHGTLDVEIFSPKGKDTQQPHRKDELYIVASGSGWFFNEGKRVRFAPGDALFAAAGEVHRFEDFTDDLVVWVIFYGPDGGERASQAK